MMNQRTVNLKPFVGIGLTFDGRDLHSSDFNLGHVHNYTIDDVKAHLLNKDIYCPELFYSKYIGADHDHVLKEKGVRLNFYVVFGGTAGIEYVKTLGYHVASYPVILECLRGRGVIVMQRGEDVIVTYIRAGNKMIVPVGYHIVISNTQFSPLILSEFMFAGARHTKTLDDLCGASYYVIRKNSRPAIVVNPHYRQVASFRTIRWKNVNSGYGITTRTPILKRLLRRHEKFQWLFKKDSVLTVG